MRWMNDPSAFFEQEKLACGTMKMRCRDWNHLNVIAVTRCESLQTIHHGRRPYVCIGVYKCTVGTFMTDIMALLYYTNSMRFPSVARGALWALNKYHFYTEGPAEPTGCQADFQSTAAHVTLCRSGKCLRYGDGSQEEEVPSITVGDSMCPKLLDKFRIVTSKSAFGLWADV